MHFLSTILNFNSYLTLLLAATAAIGDYIVSHTNLHLFQALFDNCTHGAIGALSWLIFVLNTRQSGSREALLEVGMCCSMSSFIDVDHFVAAKSLKLKDATSLKQRPFLHCSTFPLLVVFLLLCISYVLHMPWLKKFALLVLTAFLSHHTRDATRRGFWFYPFGSTAALPYSIYIIFTCLVPYLILFLNHLIKVRTKAVFLEANSDGNLI